MRQMSVLGPESRRFPQFFRAICEEAQGSSDRSETSATVSSEGLSPVEDVRRAEGRVNLSANADACICIPPISP